MSDISFDEIIKMGNEAHADGYKEGYAAALSQAQAAAERAERERGDEREWFELAKRTAIRHKQRGDTYRNRALALLKQLDFYRWAAVELTAAEARAASLEALLPWAMNQMRRAARIIELLAVGGTLNNEHGKNLYSDGLDQCADAIEALPPAAAPGDETERWE